MPLLNASARPLSQCPWWNQRCCRMKETNSVRSVRQLTLLSWLMSGLRFARLNVKNKRTLQQQWDVKIVRAKVERKWLCGLKNCLLSLLQSNRYIIAALALEESWRFFCVFYWWPFISNGEVENIHFFHVHKDNRICVHALWRDVNYPQFVTICHMFHSTVWHQCYCPRPWHILFFVVSWRFSSSCSAMKFLSGQTALFWTTFCRACFSERWQ